MAARARPVGGAAARRDQRRHQPHLRGERERRVESYVLDRTDLDLYDKLVEVSFLARIRGMVTFDGIDPLLVQMADDVEQTRTLLGL